MIGISNSFALVLGLVCFPFVELTCSTAGSMSVTCSNITKLELKRYLHDYHDEALGLAVNNSDIRDIDAETLGAKSIQFYKLQIRLTSCHILSIKEDTFAYFPNTYNVWFDHNEITNIDFLRNLSQVEVLDLSSNKIEVIPTQSFGFNNNIRTIHLQENAVRVIEGHAFNSSTLLYLYLDNNNITSIKDNAFSGLTSLQYLTLRNNNISILPENPFQDLKQLEELDLTNNKIYYLNFATFLGLTKVKRLKLEGNSITMIDRQVFNNLVRLEELQLCCNNIVNIRMGAFSQLHNLKTLNLSFNRLDMILDETLFPLKRLQIIDLSYNMLTQLGSDIGRHLYRNLQHVDIGANNWNCNTLYEVLKAFRRGLSIDYFPRDPDFSDNNIDGILCEI